MLAEFGENASFTSNSRTVGNARIASHLILNRRPDVKKNARLQYAEVKLEDPEPPERPRHIVCCTAARQPGSDDRFPKRHSSGGCSGIEAVHDGPGVLPSERFTPEELVTERRRKRKLPDNLSRLLAAAGCRRGACSMRIVGRGSPVISFKSFGSFGRRSAGSASTVPTASAHAPRSGCTRSHHLLKSGPTARTAFSA